MTLDNHSSVSILFFGVAIFMFGLNQASTNLQKLTANRARDFISRLADKKFLSISVGVFLTVLLQSSGAVTSMLVSLGAAGVVSLSEVMGIILGSAVGSTFTVQLISFNVSKFGFMIFSFCFVINYITNSSRLKMTTGVGIGFGLIFVGMELMGLGAVSFSDSPVFLQIFKLLSDSPFTTIVITALFTAFVHSSAVTIGFAMSLAATNLIDMTDAMYWIFGANIGTTGTALMAAVGGNHVSRQVAWANTFFKVGGVLVLAAFAPWLVDLVTWFAPSDLGRQIANAHSIFNVLAVLIFYPFIGLGAKWIEKLFPPSSKDKPYRTKFINSDSLATPTLAMAQANREILRMGDVVLNMLKDSLQVFKEEDPDLIMSIKNRDNKVDLLQTEIKAFLVRLGSDDGLNTQLIRMISLVSDLESAADVIEKNILDLAVKASTLKLRFSDEGWAEIKTIHSMIYELGAKSMTCFQLNDYRLAKDVIAGKREIRKLENEYRKTHYERLNRGLKESVNTSSIHLDVLSDLRRVAGLISNHAYEIIRQNEDKI